MKKEPYHNRYEWKNHEDEKPSFEYQMKVKILKDEARSYLDLCDKLDKLKS